MLILVVGAISLVCMTTRAGTHRTTVEIDVEAYSRAAGLLGTRGYKETINEALRHVDRAARLKRAADLIRSGEANLATPDDLRELRRDRQ